MEAQERASKAATLARTSSDPTEIKDAMDDALEAQVDVHVMRVRESDRVAFLEGVAVGAALAELQSTDPDARRVLAGVLVRASLLEGRSGAMALF